MSGNITKTGFGRPVFFLILDVCQEPFSGFFLDKNFTVFPFDFSLGRKYYNSAPLPGAAGHTKGSLLGSLGLFRFSFLVGENLKIILFLPVGVLLIEPTLCVLNSAELLAEDCFAVALLGEDVNFLSLSQPYNNMIQQKGIPVKGIPPFYFPISFFHSRNASIVSRANMSRFSTVSGIPPHS